jgi:hypothetical protein
MGLKVQGAMLPLVPAVPATVQPTLAYVAAAKSADFNVTTDQPIAINLPSGASAYHITRIIVTNASVSMTTAAGGVYTAASKGGTAIVAAAQVYSALTTNAKILVLTLANSDRRTESTLYFSLTTGHGSAATADIYVEIWPLT